MPPLIPQPGGRGAIYRGGVPGNSGGGNIAKRIRKKDAKRAEKWGDKLDALADDPNIKLTPFEMVAIRKEFRETADIKKEVVALEH